MTGFPTPDGAVLAVLRFLGSPPVIITIVTVWLAVLSWVGFVRGTVKAVGNGVSQVVVLSRATVPELVRRVVAHLLVAITFVVAWCVSVPLAVVVYLAYPPFTPTIVPLLPGWYDDGVVWSRLLGDLTTQFLAAPGQYALIGSAAVAIGLNVAVLTGLRGLRVAAMAVLVPAEVVAVVHGAGSAVLWLTSGGTDPTWVVVLANLSVSVGLGLTALLAGGLVRTCDALYAEPESWTVV